MASGEQRLSKLHSGAGGGTGGGTGVLTTVSILLVCFFASALLFRVVPADVTSSSECLGPVLLTKGSSSIIRFMVVLGVELP